MKKSFLPIALAALLTLAGCGGTGNSSSVVSSSSAASSSSTTPSSSSIAPVAYTVAISNKTELTPAWQLGHASRTMAISLSPAGNVLSLLNAGSLKITSSNDKVVLASGTTLSPVGVGTAKISVSYLGVEKDSVDITVTASVASIDVGAPSVGIGYSYPVTFVCKDVLSTYLNAKWTLTPSTGVKATISSTTGSGVTLAVASDSAEGTVKLAAVSSTYDSIKAEVELKVLTPSDPANGYYTGDVNIGGMPTKAAKVDSEVFYKLADDTADAVYKRPSVLFDKSIINKPYGGVNELVITKDKIIKSGASAGKMLSVTFDLYKYNNMVVYNSKAPTDPDAEDTRTPLKVSPKTEGDHIYATYTLNSEYFEASSSYDGNSYVYGVSVKYKVGDTVPAPTEIKVTGDDSIFVTDAITYSASVAPTNADSSVTWKSSNTAVATVDTDGKVTGKSAGTVTITATTKSSGSTVFGTKEVTVKAIETKTIAEAKALAADQVVSIDAVVVAVLKNGAIIGDGSGFMQIYKKNGISGLKVGDFKTFTAHTSTYNGVRELGSDVKAVANTGTAPTATLPTASELTATTFDTFDSSTATSDNVGKFAYIKGQAKVAEGSGSFYFKAEGDTAYSKVKGYISDYVTDTYTQFTADGNDNVVFNIEGFISGNKLSSGKIVGQNVIVVAADAVEKDVAPATMTIDYVPDEILVGGTYKLVCDITPVLTANKEVTWSSNNTDIATVAADGTVTGVATGTAEIVATSTKDTTKSVSCEIKVVAAYTKLNLDTETFGLSSYNKTEATKTIKGISLSYLNLGDFGDGIQMKSTSYLFNTTAITKGIKTITFTVTSSKAETQSNRNFIIGFGKTNVDDWTDKLVPVTCTDGTATYTISSGASNNTYQFFRLVYTGSNSAYFSSIVVKYCA